MSGENESIVEERWWCDVAGGEVLGKVAECCYLQRRTVTEWTAAPAQPVPGDPS